MATIQRRARGGASLRTLLLLSMSAPMVNARSSAARFRNADADQPLAHRPAAVHVHERRAGPPLVEDAHSARVSIAGVGVRLAAKEVAHEPRGLARAEVAYALVEHQRAAR